MNFEKKNKNTKSKNVLKNMSLKLAQNHVLIRNRMSIFYPYWFFDVMFWFDCSAQKRSGNGKRLSKCHRVFKLLIHDSLNPHSWIRKYLFRLKQIIIYFWLLPEMCESYSIEATWFHLHYDAHDLALHDEIITDRVKGVSYHCAAVS